MALVWVCMHVYVGNWTQSLAHAKCMLSHEAAFPSNPQKHFHFILMYTYAVIIWWLIFLVNLTGFRIAMGTDIWGCLGDR